jgi:hypothetical protein
MAGIIRDNLRCFALLFNRSYTSDCFLKAGNYEWTIVHAYYTTILLPKHPIAQKNGFTRIHKSIKVKQLNISRKLQTNNGFSRRFAVSKTLLYNIFNSR